MAKRTRIKEFSKEDLKAIHAVAKTLLGVTGILEHELKDIEQELAIALYVDSRHYLKRLGSWKSYRSQILNANRYSIIRKRLSLKARYATASHMSLNESITSTTNNISEDFQTYIDLVNQDGEISDGTEKPGICGLSLKIDMDMFIFSLPPKLQEICELMKFHSKNTTAKILKISRPTLNSRIEEIKKGMIAHGFDVYF